MHVVLRNLEMPDVPVYSVKAHKEILNSIDGVGGLGIGDGAPEIVTGSRDGESSDLTGQNWPAVNEMSLFYVGHRNRQGLGSKTKRLSGSQHGAHRGREQERLLDCCIWFVQHRPEADPNCLISVTFKSVISSDSEANGFKTVLQIRAADKGHLFLFAFIGCELWILMFNNDHCSGHAFNDQDRCVCAGYDNGDIKLFDLRNMSLRWETNIKNGVRVLRIDR